MPDIVDIANDQVERELEAAIAAARGIPSPERGAMESANECIECGDLIPSERQIAVPGCQLCVECAERMERFCK